VREGQDDVLCDYKLPQNAEKEIGRGRIPYSRAFANDYEYTSVRKGYPDINMSTVYSNVNVLYVVSLSIRNMGNVVLEKCIYPLNRHC
jgi:hypothetical protein